MIKLKNVKKSFKEVLIFDDLSWSVDKAGMYIIHGKSGSGKTTFLNILLSDKVDSGEVKVDGDITCIIQESPLIDNLTIKNNILLGRKENNRYHKLIRMLKIEDIITHYPSEVSGGQRQRAAIARSLMNDSPIILCDEPTDSLDEENKLIVMEFLKKLSHDKIVIIVTHDIYLIEKYGDYTYHLEDRNLKLIKKTNDEKRDVKTLKSKLHISDYGRFLWRINHHYYLIFGLIILLWTMIIALGVSFYRYSFNIPSSENSLNANYIYLYKENGQSYDDFLYDVGRLKIDEARPILPSSMYYHEGSKFRANIYPHPELDNFDGVHINQNVISQLEDVQIGDKLEIIFNFNGREHSIEVPIIDIINEEDSLYPNIYYDYKLLEDYLLNLLPDNEAYDIFLSNCPMVEMAYPYKDIESLKSDINFDKYQIISPLYDERIAEYEDKRLYLYFYSIILVVITLSTYISMHHINKSHNEKNLKPFLIASSNAYDIKALEKADILIKMAILSLLSILLLIAQLYFFDTILASYIIILIIFTSFDLFFAQRNNKKRYLLSIKDSV